MNAISFSTPLALLLLPLAATPWLPRNRDLIAYSWTHWLPQDTLGQWVHRLWCLLAMLTTALVIVGLAEPYRSQLSIERTVRGAELLILLDRSASMDSNIRRAQLKPGQQPGETQTKNEVVRQALNQLISERPQNRYALTLFSVAPAHVAPFSDDTAIVQSALTASGIGRGPNKTNIGQALVSAIERYDNRSYSGSRAILLVSDGGAKLDEDTRRTVREGLNRNAISLYFIYIQSGINSPDLETVGQATIPETDEAALHLFFQSLSSGYQVFQADNPQSMTDAIVQIDQQQNLPLHLMQKQPKIDYSRRLFQNAFVLCMILIILSAYRLEKL